MRKFSIVLISCVLILIGSNLNAAVVETFDTGLGGWTGSIARDEVSWGKAEGNPGGFALFQDGGQNGTYLVAPSQHLGDWSSMGKGGSISFDHKIFYPGLTVEQYGEYEIILTGTAGTATWIGDTATEAADWTTVTASIGDKNWELNVISDESLTDEELWDKLLADVTGLSIGIEMVKNPYLPGDICGIDNIEVNSVPLPGALWLLGSGLLGALGLRRATKS